MATFPTIHVFMLSFIISANANSTFLIYSEPEYAGNAEFCKFDQESCEVSEAISIKMLVGTCAKLSDSKTGKSIFVLENIIDTDYYYTGRLGPCPTHQRTIECPSGTFVKHIEWDRQFNLTKGVKLSCNKPDSISMSEATTVSSHPNASPSAMVKRTCAAFSELTISRNTSLEIDADILLEKDCSVEKRLTFANTFQCQPLTALSGMNFYIETETNFIKGSSLVCSKVDNIGSVCKAEEERELLLSNTTKSVIKKVGVGLKPSMSEKEKIEYDFYTKFGLEIEFTLSTNFKHHIGKSGKTGCDWRSAPKSTWQVEQNVTIDIETHPGCITELFEIVGKCSYITIRPYHLERVDNCSGSSFKSTEEIPHNIRTRSYKSVIPDLVKNKFK